MFISNPTTPTQSPLASSSIMETRHHLPLRDLPLEQFLTSKTPRKYKRPLSPSQTTPLNPAKRRVLDAGDFPPSNTAIKSSPSHVAPFMFSNTANASRPSRLGNGLIRYHGVSQETLSPLSSRRHPPSHEPNPNPAIESSMDPQSRHYPGFDIFRDNEHRRGSPALRVSLPSGGDTQVDRSEEDKENMPLRKKAKKLGPKKRPSSGLDGSDALHSGTPTQAIKFVHPERVPFSPRQPLR